MKKLPKEIWVYIDKNTENLPIVADCLHEVDDGFVTGLYRLVEYGTKQSKAEAWIELAKKGKAKQ